MGVEREIPDAQIVELADEFCNAAEMLLKAIPDSGFRAMRVNAVFAIELYLKSLNCHWVRHNQLETLGIDCDAITAEPDKRGHKLDQLFDHLEPHARQFLIAQFASHSLNRKYPGLRPILAEYSDKFSTDRYSFESLDDGVGHPVSETVELAVFFRSTIDGMERVRE